MADQPRDNQGSREYDKQVKQGERGGKPAGEDAIANETEPGDAGATGVKGPGSTDRGSSDTSSADKRKRGTAGE